MELIVNDGTPYYRMGELKFDPMELKRITSSWRFFGPNGIVLAVITPETTFESYPELIRTDGGWGLATTDKNGNIHFPFYTEGFFGKPIRSLRGIVVPDLKLYYKSPNQYLERPREAYGYPLEIQKQVAALPRLPERIPRMNLPYFNNSVLETLYAFYSKGLSDPNEIYQKYTRGELSSPQSDLALQYFVEPPNHIVTFYDQNNNPYYILN